jgi:hypothetical protein
MALFSLADLVRAHPWRRATFTTYALSLTFFEVVVLDELIRGGAREALVLADVEGVRSAVSELGAWRVGRDYQVEPVAVPSGVFHPKVTVLSSYEETHLVVGSGNLTFGGWGGNLETFDHLHAGFAADALADAAGFFETLAHTDRTLHAAGEHCLQVADDLMRAALAGHSSGHVRFLHSFGRPIAEQVADMAAELGGAVRLAVASPFWDTGKGLDRLCGALGLDRVYVHAHAGGTVRGRLGRPWPTGSDTSIEAVLVEELNAADQARSRQLHAKLYEVVCRRGRLLLSGSANATDAALGGRNVEACVARLLPEASVGWRWSPAVPLAMLDHDDDDAANEAAQGVLRAVLNGDGLSGQVLSGGLHGEAATSAITPEGPKTLGTVAVGDDGRFAFKAPGLELEGWKGARLVIRLEAGGRVAEGFVSQVAIAEITRRAGPIASRLFAVLKGTETPEDVAAIMAWAYENPDLLDQMTSRMGGGRDEKVSRGEAMADLASLLGGAPAARPNPQTAPNEPTSNWQRFIEAFLSQFRTPRGRLSDGLEQDTDEDADDRAGTQVTHLSAKGRLEALHHFDRLFKLLVGGPRPKVELAYSLTLGVIDRLHPDDAVARRYLLGIVHALSASNVRDEFRPTAAAMLLVALALELSGDNGEADRRARGRALRIGLEPDGPPPDAAPAEGFRTYLAPEADLAALWKRLGQVRTKEEQVRNFVSDLKSGRLGGDYPDLRADPHLWPALERALASDPQRRKVAMVPKGTNACPRHGMALPGGEAQSLEVLGIGRALNCCGGLLVCEEG